ncbi:MULTISPECIES: hypothetical protein [unclassified Hyphomonas]|jgi:hypothetical protein|uniref:hypothetical protein n=2 Tax=Hyphomonas TaxID=85 RepID=UPI000C521C7C|nr:MULTISPECIES: hypothetical protein [unclassified Hyphomonas]MAL44825.1 hypothetical protein [Hyphomonas sp.]MAX83956.1 hypothetical protein [Hyphomonas sp.]HAO35854.1 hypothetical protein [Hyphomonas sp.]HAW54572.1 hypothetical protein [Hyphomonas sp.]HBJ41279.1 hypothetical protein [Hyphomonas sp.]|tara:strand:- start:17501 stop:18361 length:861 start_codon:yes stop_codon:yes gene_type:complete
MESAIPKLALSLSEEARFSRLAELAELLESLNVGISGDRVMQLLVSDLFLGVFDPPDIEPVHSRYGHARFRNAQTIAIPDLSVFDARLLCVRSSAMADFDYRYATSRDVALTLHQVGALPMDTPKHLTREAAAEVCAALATLPIEQFSENARNLLDGVLIERNRLMHWFEIAGLMSAPKHPASRQLPEYETAANCNEPQRAVPFMVASPPPVRGRPNSDLWPRIQELVTELHRANPDRYNNEIASTVHATLTSEFPEQEILALSTIVRQMKRLRNAARSDSTTRQA